MSDATALEAFDAWWKDKKPSLEKSVARTAWLAASRSIPAAAAPTCERVTPENMHRLKAAYDAKRKVPIQLTTGDAPNDIEAAAAALLREAGWKVEEPVCGCSTYRCCRDHVPD